MFDTPGHSHVIFPHFQGTPVKRAEVVEDVEEVVEDVEEVVEDVEEVVVVFLDYCSYFQ